MFGIADDILFKRMKRDGMVFFGLVGALALVANAPALTDSSNPYERIADRNVFSLKPPPPPPSTEPPPTPAPKIELQGITSILGKRQVLFKAKISDKDQSFVLSEGQRDGEIEVLAIDEPAGEVKFNNHGALQTLSMEKDAVKAPTTVAAAPAGRPAPGAPGASAQTRNTPSTRGSQPGAAGGVTADGGQHQGLRSIPTRPTRGNQAAAGTIGSIGGVSVGSGSYNQPTQPAQPNLSREEQTILIEIERERTRDLVDTGQMPPLPPTPLTPAGSTGVPDEAIPVEH